MRSRRATVRLGVVVAVLGASTLGATYLATSKESPGDERVVAGGSEGEPDPPKEVIWQARYQAALSSRNTEQQRIDAAAKAFDADRNSSPSVGRDYLVSFAKAVPVLPLLQRIESSTEITLDELFTWQLAPGSAHPITGFYTAESLKWPTDGPTEVTEFLSRLLGVHLQKQDESLSTAEKNADTQGARDGARNQRGEVAALEAQMSNSGPLLYGISCRCTPRALDQLATDSRFALRAVEARDLFQAPIFISDPLRDKIIQTNGRFGRE